MESTEKCEAIIQHFNGKYIKTPPGVPGEVFVGCIMFYIDFYSFDSLVGYFLHHEQCLILWKSLVQCRQNPCCVNLLMEARRNVRAKGNICRTVGPGRETERPWVLFDPCFSLGALIGFLITYAIVCFPQGGMTLTYDPTTALQNGSVISLTQREWDGTVVTNEPVSLPAASTRLPTASLLTGWLVRPPSPHTCIPLCPPTRYQLQSPLGSRTLLQSHLLLYKQWL